jgi:hypothetical protein
MISFENKANDDEYNDDVTALLSSSGVEPSPQKSKTTKKKGACESTQSWPLLVNLDNANQNNNNKNDLSLSSFKSGLSFLNNNNNNDKLTADVDLIPSNHFLNLNFNDFDSKFKIENNDQKKRKKKNDSFDDLDFKIKQLDLIGKQLRDQSFQDEGEIERSISSTSSSSTSTSSSSSSQQHQTKIDSKLLEFDFLKRPAALSTTLTETNSLDYFEKHHAVRINNEFMDMKLKPQTQLQLNEMASITDSGLDTFNYTQDLK